MSKINIEFDTVEKTLAVNIDGKSVENVVCCEVYKSYSDEDDFRCSIMSAMNDEETSLSVMTRLVAAETAEGKLESAKASEQFVGFVTLPVIEQPKVEKDIHAFFAKR